MSGDIEYLTFVSNATGRYLDALKRLLVEVIRPYPVLVENYHGIVESNPEMPDIWVYALWLQAREMDLDVFSDIRRLTDHFYTVLQSLSDMPVTTGHARVVKSKVDLWIRHYVDRVWEHDELPVVGGDPIGVGDIHIDWMPDVRLAFVEAGMLRPVQAA